MSKRNGWLEDVGRPSQPRRISKEEIGIRQTMYPKTYSFHPLSTYFYLAQQRQAQFDTEIQDVITTYCSTFANGMYIAKLINPIVIQTDMPGTDHTLVHAELQGQYDIGWGVDVKTNERYFKVDNDGTTDLWKVDGARITQGNGTLFKNVYGTDEDPLSVDLSGISKINVEFYNFIDLWTLWGGFTTRLGRPLITIMYVPTTPPEPATVNIKVTNRSTGSAIRNAYVGILAGNTVVAEGYTNSSGDIKFLNVPGGTTGISYTLNISADGFHDYTESIKVKPGEQSFQYALTPIPTVPLPWWLWYVVGGAVVAGGVTIGYSALKGRQQEKVIVVR